MRLIERIKRQAEVVDQIKRAFNHSVFSPKRYEEVRRAHKHAVTKLLELKKEAEVLKLSDKSVVETRPDRARTVSGLSVLLSQSARVPCCDVVLDEASISSVSTDVSRDVKELSFLEQWVERKEAERAEQRAEQLQATRALLAPDGIFTVKRSYSFPNFKQPIDHVDLDKYKAHVWFDTEASIADADEDHSDAFDFYY